MGFGLLAAQAAYGAEDVPAPSGAVAADADGSNYALQITPYVWAAGLNGRIAPFQGAPTIGVDKSFSDVMNDFNVGGFINLWARHDRFVFSGDVMYVSTTSEKTTGPLPPLPPPLPPIPSVSASVDTKEFTSTLAGGYRLYESPSFTFDALGGVRIWSLSNRVSVQAGPLGGSYGESFAWADPVIGGRAFLRLSNRFSLQAQGDVGGFDISSRSTWSLLGTANYVVSRHLSLSAGYKVLSVDYRSDGYVFDATLKGPVVGATWRF
jgi:hypothetical protein